MRWEAGCTIIKLLYIAYLPTFDSGVNEHCDLWPFGFELSNILLIISFFSVCVGAFMVRRARIELNNAVYASQIETA